MTLSADVSLLLADIVILAMAGIIAYYGNKLFGKVSYPCGGRHLFSWRRSSSSVPLPAW